MAGPDVALLEEELEIYFRQGTGGLSDLRRAAAVLDALGPSLTAAELDSHLRRFGGDNFSLRSNPTYWGRRNLVAVEADRLTLNPASPDLPGLRSRIREAVKTHLLRENKEEQARDKVRNWMAREAHEEERLAFEAAAVRKALLRVVPDPETPRAAALLDVSRRRIVTFDAQDIRSLPEVLRGYDLLAGLRVRDTLFALKLDPNSWRLIDLSPPVKSTRINKSGRKLEISPDLIIVSSTGISRPLGSARKTMSYLESGDAARLVRRLASDVKSLYALYQFGVLHGVVSLKWGFLERDFHVDWRLPGERGLGNILSEAAATGRRIEVVLGSAPGWSDPWSRGEICEVLNSSVWTVTLRTGSRVEEVPTSLIQAIRWADHD